ncbi:MAG: TRAP transporter small permease subunit [Paracoccaceae bacterium]|nr:TRAP transporter small permease subunit [Paracoccaceae bacterium]
MADRLADYRPDRSGVSAAVERIVTWWALLGGAMLAVVVLMNVVSVLGAVVWKPVPGDFELTEIGVAIAAFMFLPYCQVSGANVTADIFTARAGRHLLALFALLASLVALGFSLLLLWRMEAGLVDQKTYGYVTAILQVPIWAAFVPILASLALLAVSAAVTLTEALRGLTGGARK